MSNNNQMGLKEQRERRNRVNRMKIGIILFVFVWLVVCMVLSVGLLIRTGSMQKQIDLLTEKTIESQQVPNADKKNTSEKETTLEKDENSNTQLDTDTTASETNPAEQLDAVRDCVKVEDNLAKEGDTHKVYLTFDDGPSENTEKILAILKKHNVNATFFVVGKTDELSRKCYKEIIDDGNTLGMHSYTHQYDSLYASVDAFSDDFHKLQDYLYDVTGEKCRYYRFPGGSSNEVSNVDMNELIDFLGEEDMVYYDWNVVSGDATSRICPADELINNVITGVKTYKTSVVLMHDATVKTTTVDALDSILTQLEAMGAEILPITDDADVIHHTALAGSNT